MSSDVEFVRLVGTERRVGRTLGSVSRHWRGKDECFLFVSPHDDDAALGSGLLMQLAQEEGVPVWLLIVTDGAMGYCSLDDRDKISQIRRTETFEAYRKLGFSEDHIGWMGLPDCQLSLFLGRQPAKPGDAAAVAGFTGLQNSLTYHLRRIRPSQVFVATRADLHPDHRMTHDELMISIFHAAGEIWPEVGKPLAHVPHVNEYAVYCDFPTPPSLRIHAPESYLQRKLEAISCFKSQRQIAATVAAVAAAGPEEYIRSTDLAFYQPARYRQLFDEPVTLRTMH